MEKASVAAAGLRGPAALPLGVAAVPFPEVLTRDAIIAWYRGEFAAANAIIDALCSHLAQIGKSSPRVSSQLYDPVFAAIRRRRVNWIPVIYMQKYFSIGDVVTELYRVADSASGVDDAQSPCVGIEEHPASCKREAEKEAGMEVEVEEEVKKGEPLDCSSSSSPDCKGIAATASAPGGGGLVDSLSCQDVPLPVENAQICSDHEKCTTRATNITVRKGFVAKESVKGHMVNVVKGLKLFEDLFMEPELSRLAEFINELHVAARNGKLPGETFIFFNKQSKGNKREMIQLGVPVFQSATDEEPSHIEPIPPLLQDVINHLIQWRLIPESRRPNSCVINFFDEFEYSQPYFKPPHLDNPISTLFLYATTTAFGRSLVSDHNGNYKGSLTLALKEGSLLVMRGNSADVARHVVCPSPSSRVSLTFLRVRTPSIQPISSPTSSSLRTTQSNAITLFKPHKFQKASATQGVVPATVLYAPQSPTWSMALSRPILMLPPVSCPAREETLGSGGTGVFLPWTVGPKKYTKHLPPRIQRRRLLSLAGPLEEQGDKNPQIPCIVV